MTVCIAVAQRFGTEIVLVADSLLSSDVDSVEGVSKMARLTNKQPWFLMYAGDPHRFPPLLGRIRDLLGDVGDSRLTVETVIACAGEAYRREIEEAAAVEILSPYGLGRKEFIENGLGWFGVARFGQLLDRFEQFDLGIELLVAGLDGHCETQLFSVSPRGAITRSVLPYHAIGSGAYLALGSLYSLAHFPASHDLAETVYRTCAAKFAAEAAPGVGRQTRALIIEPMTGAFATVLEIDRIRDLWRTAGQPKFPHAAKRSIDGNLKALRNALVSQSAATS